jgi:hypothetical protein
MLKLSGLALAAVLGAGLATGPASAMPANGLAPAATQAAAINGVQDVRYVCGPYRCWWRPGYYGPRYYNYVITTIMSGRGIIGTGTDATGGKR